MPHRLRKSRKNRGSRTCGYGKVGQHRDQGAKPGRKAGRHKHKWSYVIRYEPNYFGKKGFTCPRSLGQNAKIINIGKLDQVTGVLPTEKGKYFIDLESLGYSKLLGTGKISKPLTIKVASCSKSASQKIRDAGGEVLAESEESEG
ncbi:MAG: uL15 family ribosomal protein [Candidatus Bathyarchaeia archaeon]